MSATAASGTIPQARALAAGELLGRLFDEHGRLVLGLCRGLLADAAEAEDAAQQTFLSAYRSLLAGRLPRDEAAWIATIARNECRGRIRKRMRAPATTPLADDLPVAAVADTAETAERNADVEQLRAALRDLPARQRTALALREFYGLRQDEVAAAMGIEQATVESLLWRARKGLEERARTLPRLRTVLVVPASLREDLARLVPGPRIGMPDVDLQAVREDSQQRARTALEATLEALRAAGADATGELVADPIDALAAKVAAVDG
ncbi:MAG: sigma-70 family RNA polymerase sigma factor, partial [Thermoleophilia bacterium]|nr:sigma-70 family RNA polymerase sigma factor [Thermoleophilia bacterium]